MVQDAIQSFHWNNTQATIHPFVIYYKQDGTLKHKSLACISDMLQHDVHTLYAFQKTIILNVVKKDLPQIEKVIYFSDGCSGQYKNHKNFTNPLYHYSGYALYAEWHFFAMSHGKNACDGIGGTIKRMAAYASLQLSVTGQILPPKSLFEFANSEIPGIQSFWVPTTEITENKHLLEKRFEKSSTLPGSRSNHFFRPSSDSREILMLLVSGEEAVLVNISNFVIHDLKIGDYVACTYDFDWYAGIILDISIDNGDVYVKFMHPKGPSMLFKWPLKEDECWVALNNVIKILKPPKSNQSGRNFTFDENDIKDVISMKN